nr:Uncharacterised protein [Enterobacter mori]
MLVKLAVISSRAKNMPIFAPSLRAQRSMAWGAARNRVLSVGQLLLKKRQRRRGMVKVIYCKSESVGVWLSAIPTALWL